MATRLHTDAEAKLARQDKRTAAVVSGAETQKDAGEPQLLGPVYIGYIDTLSWVQQCHSYGPCHSEVLVDTETTLLLYSDPECKKSAGVVAIYNGGAVRDNSALVQTAMTAYLAKAPVSMYWMTSSESYSRGHGRLRAVIRMWFDRCDPC